MLKPTPINPFTATPCSLSSGKSAQMALSHLLQPNSTRRVCTLGFAAARVRFCSIRSSDGDGDSLSQLIEEVAAVDTKILLPEHTVSEAVLEKHGLREATPLGNIKAKTGGPRVPKTLSALFRVKKDDPAETVVKKAEGDNIVECLRSFKKDETPSQSTGCQNGLTFEHSAPQSAKDQATLETELLRNLALSFQSPEPSTGPHEKDVGKDPVKDVFESITTRLQDSLSNPSKLCSRTSLNKDNSSNSNVQRSDKEIEDKQTSESGFDSGKLKEQKQYPKVSLSTSNVQRSDKQVEGEETRKSGFDSGELKKQKQRPKVSLPTSNVKRSNEQIEGEETRKSGFDSGELKEQKQGPKVSLPTSDVKRFNEQIEGEETRKSGFDSGELKEQKQGPKVSLPTSDVQRSDKRIEGEETRKSGFDSGDLKEQKQRPKVLLSTSDRDQRQSQRQISAITESEENKALVRFLSHSVTKNQIYHTFKKCGEILKIECPDVQKPLLKTACVHFKTRDGLENAISKSGLHICGPVIVESANSENCTTTVHVPSLFGDPDVPAALVKNPTRTIRIEQLTPEISSHHIIEALAFCKSKVSGYFLGSSHSVAYVELETEIGKERALVEQSIDVLGRHLVMLRIDCPRTTVARITSRDHLELNEVNPLCKSLGDVFSTFVRTPYVLDVHFKVAEWPNMWKILNKLNGSIVKGRRLQAEAAPVFPPEVLLALWRYPEERKYLEATAKSLLLRLESQLDTSELAFLQNDIFST